ncbi:hypothetical protein ACFPOI_16150 [Nonomuraea angiospora]|uniref:Uncharacterized protein n=2 Tax=Nonomuraea angiospora TaxID=46172 RepID=A0ABR9MHY0_9ACTN|nr:hypothetical protein [Nonomuraea angiospora]
MAIAAEAVAQRRKLLCFILPTLALALLIGGIRSAPNDSRRAGYGRAGEEPGKRDGGSGPPISSSSLRAIKGWLLPQEAHCSE